VRANPCPTPRHHHQSRVESSRVVCTRRSLTCDLQATPQAAPVPVASERCAMQRLCYSRVSVPKIVLRRYLMTDPSQQQKGQKGQKVKEGQGKSQLNPLAPPPISAIGGRLKPTRWRASPQLVTEAVKATPVGGAEKFDAQPVQRADHRELYHPTRAATLPQPAQHPRRSKRCWCFQEGCIWGRITWR
jgi:hypothetical protein